MEGPFGRHRVRRFRTADGHEGEILFVSGRVLGHPGCPDAGAVLDVWRADHEGVDDDEEPAGDPEEVPLAGTDAGCCAGARTGPGRSSTATRPSALRWTKWCPAVAPNCSASIARR